MKKGILFLVLLCPLWLFAGNPGFGERHYSLSAMAEYSYNTTWGHHGNFDVQALMPFNPHFEMEAKLQFSTANVHTMALQFRPKFELPVGEMFLETDVLYRAVARNRIHDFTAALGVGYRMDHVSVTLGVFSRVMDDWDRDWHSNETYVVEPFNLLYRIEVFCRPQNNPWNLSFMFSADMDLGALLESPQGSQSSSRVGACTCVSSRAVAGVSCFPSRRSRDMWLSLEAFPRGFSTRLSHRAVPRATMV